MSRFEQNLLTGMSWQHRNVYVRRHVSLGLFGMPVNHMVCGILEPIFADRVNVNLTASILD